MVKGYTVPDGFMGLVEDKYQLFETECAYYEYMLERKEYYLSKEISPQIFNNLCKNCGERSSCKGMCIELNNILIKRREVKIC